MFALTSCSSGRLPNRKVDFCIFVADGVRVPNGPRKNDPKSAAAYGLLRTRVAQLDGQYVGISLGIEALPYHSFCIYVLGSFKGPSVLHFVTCLLSGYNHKAITFTCNFNA